MPRIEPVDQDSASEEVAQLLEQAGQVDGQVINLHRELANSEAALQGYVGLKGALAEGNLPLELQEEIAIAVSDADGCTY